MKITGPELAERQKLDAARKALETQARALKSKIDAIDAKAKAALKASGKPTIKRGDFRLSWQDVHKRVRWQDEYIAIAPAGTPMPVAEKAQKLLIADA